jgi:hypothetical protein
VPPKPAKFAFFLKESTHVLYESYLFGYIGRLSLESQPNFKKKISPPFSGFKNKPCIKAA